MIAAVRGEVMVRRPDHVVIEAGGVGYRLTVSAETLKAVPATGRDAFLHAELISREDSLALYGFASEEERDLFGQLVSVSGVGPKVAIAALSGGPARELLRAIAAGDAKRFQAVPGIGKRTAERIIVELREKVAGALEEEVMTAVRRGRRRALLRPRRPGQPRLRAAGGRAAARRDREWRPRAADRDGAAQGRDGQGGMSAKRIRTPGIDEEPIPVDAEVRVHDARADVPDEDLDRSLRPPTLADFVNQAQATDQLSIFIEAARQRGEPLDHVLLAGPPGLGKTSLAHIVAAEMGVPLVQTAGPALERKADVASFLTALEPGSVFFVDEIHRLGRAVEETLYPAMEDGELPVVLGQGAGARTVTLPLPPFTLVGATTRSGLLTTPLRDRFGVCHRLEHYSPDHLAEIVERSASILDVEIDTAGARTIAERSRGTPRVANRLLKRVRDFAQVKGRGAVDAEVAAAGLEMLEVDAGGLDRSDRNLLETVATKFAGGPVGLSTLAVAIGEEQDTIEDVFEPYLLQEGLLKRTPRGRVLTMRAYEHLGMPAPEGAESLF